MDPVDTHKHIKRLHVYILVLTVAILALVWFLLRDQIMVTKKDEAPVTPSVTTIKKENKGEMTLQSAQRQVAVGTPFVVQVVATSEGEDIVGFDALLGFDQDAFTVGSVSTPVVGFRAVSTPQGDHLSVTGVQDPQSTTRNVFEKTVVLEVTFSPKTAGNYDIVILPKAGAETSKLVTTQTNILFPEVKNLSVTVE